MTRTKSILAGGLSAALALGGTGCSVTHLGGAYRTAATDVSSKQEMRTLDDGSTFPLFWGLFEAGSYDANRELAKKLRPDEEITNLEIKERISVGGFFLWLITAGIVSHHTIEVRGVTAVSSRPPAEPATGAAATPTRERERTIVTPAAPAPAGYERERVIENRDGSGRVIERDRSPAPAGGAPGQVIERETTTPPTGPIPIKANRSADYNEGYRDGARDQGRVVITGDGPVKSERSADYNEGYRDGVRGR
jgi:hypothetical protein